MITPQGLGVQSSASPAAFQWVGMGSGSNADEWKIYLEPGATVEDWLVENLPPRLHERARNALDGYADDQRALDALITANAYVCPSMDLARAVQAAGGSSWMYYFSRVRPGEKAAGMGAYHGAELPYVFNTHDSWLPTAGEDRTLSAAMMGYWISFAASGDPNTSNLPRWPEFGSAGKSVMQLDTELVAIDHPSGALCAILAEKDDVEAEGA